VALYMVQQYHVILHAEKIAGGHLILGQEMREGGSVIRQLSRVLVILATALVLSETRSLQFGELNLIQLNV